MAAPQVRQRPLWTSQERSGISSEDVRGVPQVSQRERDFPHQDSPATVRRATTFRKDPRTLPSRKPKEKRTISHTKGTPPLFPCAVNGIVITVFFRKFTGEFRWFLFRRPDWGKQRGRSRRSVSCPCRSILSARSRCCVAWRCSCHSSRERFFPSPCRGRLVPRGTGWRISSSP